MAEDSEMTVEELNQDEEGGGSEEEEAAEFLKTAYHVVRRNASGRSEG